MRSSIYLAVISGCSFFLAFGITLHLSKSPPDLKSPVSRQNENQGLISLEANAVESHLRRSFLSEDEWDALLGNLSHDDLLKLVDSQPAEFWRSKPIGVSAAYRLFGGLGRVDSALALNHTIQVFTRAEVGRGWGRNCLRWAVLGIVQSQNSIDIEAAFSRSPREFWRGLIQGAIGGTDSGSLPDDVQHFNTLLTRLFDPDASKENKVALNDILRGVVEAWVERDPAVTAAWLQSKAGEPYQDLLPKAVALATLGGGEALLKQVIDQKNGLPIHAAASAFYLNGADENVIKRFVEKLPESARKQFLAAYGRELAKGSPAVISEFLETADASLLTPEVAKALCKPILDFDPRLFEKLTSQMTPIERNELLEDGFRGQNKESSVLYLEHIGVTGTNGRPALSVVAAKDLEKALSFVNSAPQSQQEKLRSEVYDYHVSKLVRDGTSLDELFAFAKSAPAEFTSSISEAIVSSLATEDPRRCLETLDKYYPNDGKMWTVAFGGGGDRFAPILSADQIDAFLLHEIEKGVSPAVYSAAAQGMTAAFARVDTDQARAAVEALTDEKVKAACATVLVQTWAASDPLGAAAYAGQLPFGAGRDSAIAAVLPNLSFAPNQREKLLSLVSSDNVRDAFRAQIEAQRPTTPGR